MNLVQIHALFLNWRRSVCHSLSDQGPVPIPKPDCTSERYTPSFGDGRIASSQISLLIINKGMVHVQHMVNVASSSATNEGGVKVSLAGHVSIVFRTFNIKYNA